MSSTTPAPVSGPSSHRMKQWMTQHISPQPTTATSQTNVTGTMSASKPARPHLAASTSNSKAAVRGFSIRRKEAMSREKPTLLNIPDELLVSVSEMLCNKSLQNLAIAGIQTVKSGGKSSIDPRISSIARETLRKRFHILYIEPNHASLDRVRQICDSPEHVKHITELKWMITLQSTTWREMLDTSLNYALDDAHPTTVSVVLKRLERLTEEQDNLFQHVIFDRELRSCLQKLPNLKRICIMADPMAEQHFPNGQPCLCSRLQPCDYHTITAYNRPRYWQHSSPPLSIEPPISQTAATFMEDRLLHRIHYGDRPVDWAFDNPLRILQALSTVDKQLSLELVFIGPVHSLTESQLDSFKGKDPQSYLRVVDMINIMTLQFDGDKRNGDDEFEIAECLPWLELMEDSSITTLNIRGLGVEHRKILGQVVQKFVGPHHLKTLAALNIWSDDEWYYACEHVPNPTDRSQQSYTPQQLWRFLSAHKSTLRELALVNSTGCDLATGIHSAAHFHTLLQTIKKAMQLTKATITETLLVGFGMDDINATEYVANARDAQTQLAGAGLAPPGIILPVPNVVPTRLPPFYELRPLPFARDRAREKDSSLGKLARQLGIGKPREYHIHRCKRVIELDGEIFTPLLWDADRDVDQLSWDYEFGTLVLNADDSDESDESDESDDSEDLYA